MRDSDFRRLHRAKDVAGLARGMRDASFTRRVAIVGSLTGIGSSEAESALMDALSDSSAGVRRVAVLGLATIDPDRDPAPVLSALWGDQGTLAQRSPDELYETGLYRLRALDTVPILIQGLGSENRGTPGKSAMLLGEIADPRAGPALIALLSHPKRAVRSSARRALRKIDAAHAAR